MRMGKIDRDKDRDRERERESRASSKYRAFL